MGGSAWRGHLGKIGATSPIPLGLGATSPVPLCQGRPHPQGPAGRKWVQGQDEGKSCHSPSCSPDANPAQTQPLPHRERGENVPGRGGRCPEPRFWQQPVTGTHCFGQPWVWYPPGGIARARVAPTSVTVSKLSFKFLHNACLARAFLGLRSSSYIPDTGKSPVHPWKSELGE